MYCCAKQEHVLMGNLLVLPGIEVQEFSYFQFSVIEKGALLMMVLCPGVVLMPPQPINSLLSPHFSCTRACPPDSHGTQVIWLLILSSAKLLSQHKINSEAFKPRGFYCTKLLKWIIQSILYHFNSEFNKNIWFWMFSNYLLLQNQILVCCTQGRRAVWDFTLNHGYKVPQHTKLPHLSDLWLIENPGYNQRLVKFLATICTT